MLSNKMDLRVAIITFLLNSRRQITHNLIQDYYLEKNYAKKEIYKILNSRCNIKNYDEVDLLIKKYHKNKEIKEYENNNWLYYFKLLSKLGESFISHRDSKIILKHWESKSEKFLGVYNGLNKIAIWNTLSREINIDIIVFQYMIDNGINDYRYLQYYHSLVHIEDLQLDRVLSNGVAETHMHVGAGINFEIKWHDLMNTELENEDYKIVDISIGEGIENDTLRLYRQIAILYRIILSKYLVDKDKYSNIAEFLKLYKIESIDLENLIKEIVFLDNEKSINEVKSIVHKIKYMMDVYNSNYTCDDRYAQKMNKSDFLSSIFKNIDTKINTTLENILLFEGLNHIKNNSENDKLFSCILYKYILIKNIFYRVTTQDNLIKGLDRFSLSNKRSTKMLDSKNLLYLSLHTQIRNRNLKKLEIRVSFPNKSDEIEIEADMRKNLKYFFNTYLDIIRECEEQKNSLPQIGVVYNFKKYKDSGQKCWLQHLIYDDETRLYYEKNRKEYLNQINVLLKLREGIPGLSNYIVGIDAASGENNTEPWVFSPIFKNARNTRRKLGIVEDHSKLCNINTLGFTFHVGEEFRHIISGLRHIDEVIRHLNFKSGDRIGHAIALGIDIKEWAEESSIIIIPRIEYLDNLLWIWSILTNNKTTYNGDINYIERKIMNTAGEIYDNISGINVHILYESYVKRFDATDIDQQYNKDKICKYSIENYHNVFCKNVDDFHRISWDSKKIYHSNHCSDYIEKMNEPIEVIIEESDIELLIFAQNEVKNLIAKEGIIVETNPTSNRSIGEIDNIFEHYITSLNNVDTMEKDNIMVSINTDDPCVFNTNINNEYAYIFYSLIKKGYDRNTCLDWIDKIRKISIDQSFIKTRNISIEDTKKEIKDIIDSLR